MYFVKLLIIHKTATLMDTYESLPIRFMRRSNCSASEYYRGANFRECAKIKVVQIIGFF